MGLSDSSVKPVSTDSGSSSPAECPMHKQQSQSAASGECPASVGAGKPVVSDEADIDLTNMVSTVEICLLIYDSAAVLYML